MWYFQDGYNCESATGEIKCQIDLLKLREYPWELTEGSDVVVRPTTLHDKSMFDHEENKTVGI